MFTNAETIGVDENLGQDVPAPLVSTPFAKSYIRDAAHHRMHLPAPSAAFLRTLAENAEVVAYDRPSLLYFGGGKISTEDFDHAVRTSGHIASGHTKTQSNTGSGPGIMTAAHLGPTLAINGHARNVGLTLEGLVHRESPGSHNDELLTLANMSRRLELFLRLSQGGVIFPGGIGTLEEIAAVLAILFHDKNKGVHYPFVLSEREQGGGTFMTTVMEFLGKTVGPQVQEHFTLHQGPSANGLSSLTRLSPQSGGHWNQDLYLPSTAFHPFRLDEAHVAKIDLSDPQDNPVRFLGHVRWFMNLLVQLVMIDREGIYIAEHGKPVVRATRPVREALLPVLDLVWQQKRIKTDAALTDLITWRD